MKKYFISFLTVCFVITIFFVPISKIKAESTMTISQFAELLITLGVVPADRIVAVRAAVVQLNTATTSATVNSIIIATSTSYIQVLSPNGGESWEIDLDIPYQITWGSSGLTQAFIALVSTKNKNPVCNLTNIPVSSKNGNHTYSVLLKTARCYNLITSTSTALVDGSYRARVYFTDSVGTTIQDDSNAAFKIIPKLIPSIKVTYPNGSETLKRNTDYDVTYRLTNVNSVEDNLIYLFLLDNNGNTVYNSHRTKTSGGTYSLDLPSSLPAGAYKVKLKTTESVDGIDIEDVSDNFFWISTGL